MSTEYTRQAREGIREMHAGSRFLVTPVSTVHEDDHAHASFGYDHRIEDRDPPL